jgi:hypothetical protein
VASTAASRRQFLSQDHRQTGFAHPGQSPDFDLIDGHTVTDAVTSDLHKDRRLLGRLRPVAAGDAGEVVYFRQPGKNPIAKPLAVATMRKRRRSRPLAVALQRQAVTTASARAWAGGGRSAWVRLYMGVSLQASVAAVFDGSADAHIGAAAAGITGHGGVDVSVSGFYLPRNEMRWRS